MNTRSEINISANISVQRKSNAHLDNSLEVIENEETHNVYKENFWPAPPEEPKGYTFKGKGKMMTYAMEKVKSSFKKGVMKQLGKTEFKILDNKKFGGATQIEINVSDNEGRGSAIVDFWGPNKKKECTVLIKKEQGSREICKNTCKENHSTHS